MKAYIMPFLKAFCAAMGAAVASLITAGQGEAPGNAITTQEYLIAAGAFLAIFTATFFVPYYSLNNSPEAP
jgi:hypothetical protein